MPFNYFGRKARIAHLYPRADLDTIIEPFAGSAAYALHADNWTRRVILVERHPDIAALWRWLIDPATTPETILRLPAMPHKGADLEELGFGPPGSPDRTLASLSSPSADFHKRFVSDWMRKGWEGQRARVAADIRKVKHWELIEGDYTDAPDLEATWFIDPPYQKIQHGYDSDRAGIDFEALGSWCQSRPGQIIVAEESGADWLPFQPLTAKRTLNDTATIEVIYTNTIDNLLDYAGLEQ
jgi:hypothetical protein